MSREELQQKLLADLQQQYGDKLIEAKIDYGMPVVVVDESIYHDIFVWLKGHAEWRFDHFIDITAVDYFDTRDKRFEVVVHLRSNAHNLKLRIKYPVGKPGAGEGLPVVPTITDVYVGALWTEREVFDLVGITFEGHPRMTRLLMPDDFDGHPLRKDFPVKGKHRGSFPRGTVVSNKRREQVSVKVTKPKPADQLLPNTPWEQKRDPLKPAEQEKVEEGGDA